MKPLCFVLMPFGRKPSDKWRVIDFDAVYRTIIAPAIDAAGMDAIRADEEQVGGAIHKPMYERLMLCEYAIADVTGANPNVYYEMGVRHALRPRSTVILFAAGTTLPFDIALLRGLPYALDDRGLPAAAPNDVEAIAARLKAARQDHTDDSPIFQLIEGMPRVEVDHTKTDVFRDRANYSKKYKDALAVARTKGFDAVSQIAADPALANAGEVEVGVLVDLYLSWRDVKAYDQMVDLYGKMPKPLQRTRLVREQLAFALNRLGRHEEAEREALAVIKEHGESSETNGILGRIYKDRWEAAHKAGHTLEARGLLKKAIAAYVDGFEADWRDPYPGVNAVTLMELAGDFGAKLSELLPVVRYAASQRAERNGDYWDDATLLELAVIARDGQAAEEALENAAAAADVAWKAESTTRNLRLISDVRKKRGEEAASVDAVITELDALVERLRPKG